MRWAITFLLGILLLLDFSLAAHFIVGYVNDAGTGELANGKTITLWNPTNGQSDNVTDTIGPLGNSGANNIYLIDCELLNIACTIGDELSLKIFNNGDDNVSEIINITVTGAGFDQANNLTLNSPPQVNLISPENNTNHSTELLFNCSFFDYDNNIANVSLWGNWSTGWQINETLTVSPGDTYKTFLKNISDGSYVWSCSVEDNLSISRFASENRTITVDTTPPVISSVAVNITNTCTNYAIRVNCTATDALIGLDSFIIQAMNATDTLNYPTSLLAGNTYYSDIIIDAPGNWTFNCIVNDTLNNTANKTSTIIDIDSENADLFLDSESITIDKTPQTENENITITANISNEGCSIANNLLIGYYDGDKDSGGIAIQNITTTINDHAWQTVNITWPAEISLHNIFVYADVNNSFSEVNESNNQANKTIYLRAWQEIYGNTTINKILGNYQVENITFWQNHSEIEGNVFIADSESTIDWYSLQAFGKNTTNATTTNDYTEFDTLLGMTSFNDSIYNIFTNAGTPKGEDTFALFSYTIENVPVINSTLNGNFITGMLWDTSDDSNGEFDATEKEDIVFVGRVSKATIGAYGTYDYEITIPSRLRQYDSNDTTEVFFYYEIN